MLSMRSALLFLLFPFSTSAFAGLAEIVDANNQIKISRSNLYMDYAETAGAIDVRLNTGKTPGTLLDTEDGPVSGFSWSISAMRDLFVENDYLNIEYSYHAGSTRYIGAYLSGGSYGSVVSRSGAILTDISIQYGRGAPLSKSWLLTPYFEIGRHYWWRGVNYGETYTHNYYGVGLLGQYSPSRSWVFSFHGLLGNTQGANIDVVGASASDPGFSGALGLAQLTKIGAEVGYVLPSELIINFAVESTQFKYGSSATYPSKPGYVQWEPDSATTNTTVRLGLGVTY